MHRGASRKRGQEPPLGKASLSEARKRKGTRRPVLSSGQTKRCGKTFWDAEESNRHLSSCERARIASQPLCPRETRMGTFSTRKRRGSDSESGIPRLHLDLYTLVTKQLDAGTSMNPSIPVTPEDRSRTDHHRM